MMNIVDGKNGKEIILLVFFRILEFFLFYIRNTCFIGAALFLFAPLVIIMIFFQDELHIDLLGNILMYIDTLPIIGNMVSMSNGIHADTQDLINFFYKTSFYFTIFTEIIRYIKIYVFKKEDKNSSLMRRIYFSVIGVTVVYSFTSLYVVMSLREDVVWGIVISVIFWLICCVATVMFILMDFAAKKLHIVTNRIDMSTGNHSM